MDTMKRRYIVCDYDGEPSWYNGDTLNSSRPYRWKESELELVRPQGPVRTRTVTEIVPGVYGRLEIDTFNHLGVAVGFVNSDGVCRFAVRLAADELTAAIETLTQIRDALKEKSDGNN